jgi:hypothetical protein
MNCAETGIRQMHASWQLFARAVALCLTFQVDLCFHSSDAFAQHPWRQADTTSDPEWIGPPLAQEDGLQYPQMLSAQHSSSDMAAQTGVMPATRLAADPGSPYQDLENFPISDPYVLRSEIPEEPMSLWEDWSLEFARVPQRTFVTGTYLGSGGNDGLGIAEFDVSTTFATSVPWLEQTHFSITPSFGLRSLHAPEGIPLPSELVQGSVMFALTRPISEDKKVTIGVAQGYYGDMNGGGSDAFRLLAVADLEWQYSPTTQWKLGVVATGRDDLPILPLAGVIWIPSPEWQFDLTVPRPRVSYRLIDSGGVRDHWLYLGGEFGGGTYAVDREGRDDLLNLQDFRLFLGWETRGTSAVNARVETGFVFGREAEYDSDGFKYEPSDTWMIRAGVSF